MTASIRRQVAVIVVSVAASAAWLAAGPADASPEEEEESGSSLTAGGATGLCGWFHESRADGFEAVNLCAYDGFVAGDGESTVLVEPLVVIDRYACSFRSGRSGEHDACDGDRREFSVDRAAFVVDPLLRRATIVTNEPGCRLEIEFVSQSNPTPAGGLWTYHGGEGWLHASGQESLTRKAQWWGTVCGRFLVSEPGAGEMWRTLGGGAAGSAAQVPRPS